MDGFIKLTGGTLDIGGVPEDQVELFVEEFGAVAKVNEATGSITLVSQDNVELFNHHHAKDGKFGQGGSNDSASTGTGPGHGDHVSKEDAAAARHEKLKKIAIGVGIAVVVTGLLVAGVHYDNTHLEGQKIQKAKPGEVEGAKGAYAVKGKHGQNIVLVDVEGMSGPRRKILLKDTKHISDMDPLDGNKDVNIIAKGVHDLSPNAEAFTSPGIPNTIMVNTKRFFGNQRNVDLAHRPDGKTYFQPSYYHGGIPGQHQHLLFHEYGHLHEDGKSQLNEANDVKSSKIFKSVKPHLTTYAKTDRHESYAENFAEFHATRGKTTSASAQAYAKEFGWKAE